MARTLKRSHKFIIFMLLLASLPLFLLFSYFLFNRLHMELLVLQTESSFQAWCYWSDYRAYAVRRFVQRLNHQDPGVREGAAAALGIIGRRRTVKERLYYFEDLPRLEKEQALAKKLGIPALKKSLKDPAETVRFEAACALARMDDDSGLEELLKYALREPGDENYFEQRTQALKRLGKLGYGEAIEILIDDLEKAPEEEDQRWKLYSAVSSLVHITEVRSSPDIPIWEWADTREEEEFKEKELAFWKKWWQENKRDPRWSKRWKK